MTGAEAAVPLDECGLLIAAHAYPGLEIDRELERLDALAEGCAVPTLDGLVGYLFGDLGFVGNTTHYFDPRNSFLNDVLERRTGIPISLGVLALSVGRRVGVPMVGVGMPGHFLLRDQVDQEVFMDPFAGGALLDLEGCARAFRSVHGDDAEFRPSFVEPFGAFAIVARMLANLLPLFAAKNDRASLAWVLRLRTLVPGVPDEERAELAAVLAAAGRFHESACEYDNLATCLGGDLGSEYRNNASRMRARLN